MANSDCGILNLEQASFSFILATSSGTLLEVRLLLARYHAITSASFDLCNSKSEKKKNSVLFFWHLFFPSLLLYLLMALNSSVVAAGIVVVLVVVVVVMVVVTVVNIHFV